MALMAIVLPAGPEAKGEFKTINTEKHLQRSHLSKTAGH
jgi:hypothetical protein